MAKAVRRYTDEIHGHFSYWATWLPTSHVRLGDLGPVRKRVFQPQTSLEDLGISIDAFEPSAALNLEHTSVRNVMVTFQTEAGNHVIPQIPQGKAGVEVAFTSSGGVLFVVRDGRERRIRNLDTVGAELLSLIRQGDLPREYALVTHVVEAEAVTVLISSVGSARFVASAEADFTAGLLDLANLAVTLSRVSSTNVETEIVALRGATPLLKLSGFKRGGWFWGSPRVAPLGFDSDDDPGTLDELALDETDDDNDEG